MTEYIYPDVLVSTAWVAEHRNDPTIRIVESDEDILLYDVGHPRCHQSRLAERAAASGGARLHR
jgi:hypothetical protein